MLFRSLLRAWRSRKFLAEVLQDFDAMLGEVEQMFAAARRFHLEGAPAAPAQAELETRDERVNKLEASIRRRLVQHLAMDPESETIASLVMFGAVKDAERIGDYCKNILEVGGLLGGPLPASWLGHLRGLFGEVAGLFPRARKAFLETAEAEGAEVVKDGARIAGACEARLHALCRSDLPANPAVCLALLLRHLKRVAAHLRHIAATAAQPVEELEPGEGR